MPYSDAIAYFHGSGASSGAITQTANTLTGVSQSGTTLTYTVATGQVQVGQVVVLVGGAPTVTNTVTVVAILTGGGLTGTATVNISQTVTTTTATVYPAIPGDTLCASASQYSNLELDFGAPNPGTAYPWIPGFPSLTEKGYTFPPEHPGSSGVTGYGVHIVVTAPFLTLTSINFQVVTSAATAALFSVSANIIAQRSLTLAQLQVVGADYFIPVNQEQTLEFLRWYAALTGSAATAGNIVSYWGPRMGGEM
jgi:hypothetical protein